jgi:hypothetical protein
MAAYPCCCGSPCFWAKPTGMRRHVSGIVPPSGRLPHQARAAGRAVRGQARIPWDAPLGSSPEPQ